MPGTKGEDIYYPFFEGELANILGLHEFESNVRGSDHTKLYLLDGSDSTKTNYQGFSMETGYQVSNRPLDLSAGYHSIFVYTDIIESSLIGDSLSQLIKVVEIPADTKFGDQVVIKYNNPQYFPLLRKEFSTIQLDLKDDSNSTVPFLFGRTIVTLHFRKKSFCILNVEL